MSCDRMTVRELRETNHRVFRIRESELPGYESAGNGTLLAAPDEWPDSIIPGGAGFDETSSI